MGIHEQALFEDGDRANFEGFIRTVGFLGYVAHGTGGKGGFKKDLVIRIAGEPRILTDGSAVVGAPVVGSKPEVGLNGNELAQAIRAGCFIDLTEEVPEVFALTCRLAISEPEGVGMIAGGDLLDTVVGEGARPVAPEHSAEVAKEIRRCCVVLIRGEKEKGVATPELAVVSRILKIGKGIRNEAVVHDDGTGPVIDNPIDPRAKYLRVPIAERGRGILIKQGQFAIHRWIAPVICPCGPAQTSRTGWLPGPPRSNEP